MFATNLYFNENTTFFVKIMVLNISKYNIMQVIL